MADPRTPDHASSDRAIELQDPIDGPVIAMDGADGPVIQMDRRVEDDLLHLVPLRADLANDVVQAPPGETVEVSLQVLNTSAVIETIHVRVLGLMAESIEITPPEVTLFPDESATFTIGLTFHRTLPAGEHEALLVVSGTSGQAAPAEVPLRVEVPGVAAASLVAEPPLRTGGRRVGYELVVGNEGNTPLTMQIRVADADRVLALELENSTLNLRVDETDGVRLLASKHRPWTGPAVDHVITVDLTGDGIEETAELRFRQKPRLTAGVLTIMTLSLVVGLWALAMVFGVQAALAPTSPTKLLPETFLAGVGLEDLDPTVAGGSVSGTITAASTAKPLARATVEAFDQQGRLVGATATGDDGEYVLEGLLPVRHRLRIRAVGFAEQWWPSAPTAAGASALLVSPTTPAEGVNSRLAGAPSAMGGQAIAGDGDPVPVSVEVLALDLLESPGAVTTTADASGVWQVGDLPAPATYRITYRAEGYAPLEVTQPLDAGQQLVVNTVRLPAATGSISGLVVDRAGTPVGGVEISAQRGDTAIDFTTPTSGEVGFFTFEDLETPGTYLLTLAAEGFASETRAVRLGPGEAVDQLQIVLGPATGVISGLARTAGGTPLGGATVTVSGGGTVLTTETLTSGTVGSFRLAGLPLPGVYAVTFDLPGYSRQTVRVELDTARPEGVAEVRMSPSVGAIAGRVVDDASGQPLSAVAIEVSDGTAIRTTTTASVPAADSGTFHVGDLAPGSYTVTATTGDGRTVTVLQTVTAGATTDVTIRVGGTP